jgi:4-hydroxy-2-oxoheptanedioate aldolase
VATCKKHKVVVGHPHVETANAERIIKEGYRYLMCAAPRSFGTLEKARGLAGRQ